MQCKTEVYRHKNDTYVIKCYNNCNNYYYFRSYSVGFVYLIYFVPIIKNKICSLKIKSYNNILFRF